MRVEFETGDIPLDRRGETDAVLQRIAVGEPPGRWRTRPDVIKVLAKLAGGRSGAEVLEVVVRWGNEESARVIKVGPHHELRNEFHAFRRHLQHANRFFIPIQAATPALLERNPPPHSELEAIVYDHASRFVAGKPAGPTRTFEQVAREAVAAGGKQLADAAAALRVLLQGIRNDLYEKHELEPHETTLHESWNPRLGDDAKVAIAVANSRERCLTAGARTARDLEVWWPRDVAEASVRTYEHSLPQPMVVLPKARLSWWGARLMAEEETHHLRVEVVADGRQEIGELAQDVKDGSTWRIEGRLIELRALKHQALLAQRLPELTFASGVCTGPGARVPDPFLPLAGVLEGRRSNRVTALVHGDLNPRNILLVDEQPCLIDYAFTRAGEPVFIDFTRLEGCLARDTLPTDFTWVQHVRLQRLLAWASHLGEEAACHFAERLYTDRPELGHAFRLLWEIRRAAPGAYPPERRGAWLPDYFEQLFLFAHLTLKWGDQGEAPLRASVAMAGVAAEALTPEASFRHWDEASLRDDGLAAVDVMRRSKQFVLPALASFSQRITPLVGRKDDPLQRAVDEARSDLVRDRFHDEANELLRQLQADHEVYINLRAFIDLKGQLSAGREMRRRPLSMEALLADGELLADWERLRTDAPGQDALGLVATHPALVLVGDAGAGKSTVARELEFRLARLVANSGGEAAAEPPRAEAARGGDSEGLRLDPRLPLMIRASAVEAHLSRWKEGNPESAAAVLDRSSHLLAVGALHLIVDGLNELDEEQRRSVADWVVALRTTFPQTPVLVCHRHYGYSGLLPFPVVLLQKVETDQARRYIHDYLREKGASDHEQRAKVLVRHLLDSPDFRQVRDLAQTPLFLWMLVERYRVTSSLPASRGGLFDDFSRWYLEERYHAIHNEPFAPTQCSYEDKARFLGCLGYELVRRRETELPERNVRQLVVEELRDRWQALLNETVAAEMLHREGGKLRFFHQSFQEYFAARHFLDHEAEKRGAIRARVREHGWHDTFAVLLGFGGDHPHVIRHVIEEALQVSAVLTARCLRMAETPDPMLLRQFVGSQHAVLRDAQAGKYPQERAAEALAAYGSGPARAALWAVATDSTAPEFSRVVCLTRLAGIPGQARFDVIAGELRNELVKGLAGIFDEPAPVTVREAAVSAVVQTELKDLSTYLVDLVQAGEWPLRRAAWDACKGLGLVVTPRQHSAFLRACRERLGPLEEELTRESVANKFDALNEERLEILSHLATSESLPTLLPRRFAFGIHDDVGRIIDTIAAAPAAPPAEAQQAWAVLTEGPQASPGAVDRWFALLGGADELVAMAAAHRLCELREALPAEGIRGLFDPSLPPPRLSAIAGLAAVSRQQSLVEPLEQLVRPLIETVAGHAAMEAFANLVTALIELDRSRGSRVAEVANYVFYQRRHSDTLPGTSAWAKLRNSIHLSEEDYSALLEAGGDSLRAAVYRLNELGGSAIEGASRAYPVQLKRSAMRLFQKLPDAEQRPAWKHLVTRAAVKVEGTALAPWLLEMAETPAMHGTYVKYHSVYGPIREAYVADVLRAAGCFARVLLDKQRADEAQPAVTYLRRRYSSLEPGAERSIVVGLATGLGYLGLWEPILTHLGPDEPWMHDAAENVFLNWVPGPLAAKPKKEEERAARWIIRRLRNDPNLPPEVRSTLGKIKESLESRLGRHFVEDEA